MKWTKQRKIAVGLLSVAFVAFVGDRVFLHASEEVVADASGHVAAGDPAGASASKRTPAAKAVPTTLPMEALARRLEQVCMTEGLTPGHSEDAFTPPADWFPAPPVVVGTPVVNTPLASRSGDFKARYRLTAIMRSGNRTDSGLAVIQGETIRIGHAIGGFTLKAINDRSVLLTDGQEQLELELPDSNLATVQ